MFRVNFCAGDAAYWGRRPAWAFRGALDGLGDFLDDRIVRFGITDLVLFGDCRPVHLPALAKASEHGVRIHVFEEGYFRPFWVTLERDGVNARSRLPRDPDWYRETASRLPGLSPPVRFRSPFWLRATHDVVYHLAGALNPLWYPRYRTHAPVTAPVEYAGYVRRFARLRWQRSREFARAETLAHGTAPYFLLPLQLNGDAQIREHSRFRDMGEVIDEVMTSFARHAPSDALLVIKNHPLDMGLVNYRRQIGRLARHLELEDRVHFLEDGDLRTLVAHARGVVTVNSTVGLASLAQGRPTLALSDPIYALPGLTAQEGLDVFWQARIAPDASLYAAFHRVVMQATQVNGGFYCPQGIRLAVENCGRILVAERSPLEELV